MENIKNNYYTFGMIKPNGMRNIRQILEMIYNAGLKIEYYECDLLTEQLIDENYAHCMHSTNYSLMKKNLLSGPVLKMIIYDEKGEAVEKYKRLLVNDGCSQAEVNAIRTVFSDKSFECKNVLHASSSEKKALEEIIRFFGNDLFLIFDELKNTHYNEMILLVNGICSTNKRFVDDKINSVLKHCDDYVKKMS